MTVSTNRMAVCGVDPTSERPRDEAGGWRLMAGKRPGYVRQRYVGSLVALSDPWIAPFVVQLCGEYVVEIITQIEASLSSMDPHVYGAFFRNNPVFLERTYDRMISYWDCYCRWLYKRKRDYVGFRVFERFREWEASI